MWGDFSICKSNFAIVISNCFVSVTYYVFKYMESISDSTYFGIIHGNKTYGNCDF